MYYITAVEQTTNKQRKENNMKIHSKCSICNKTNLLIREFPTGYNQYGKPINKRVCKDCYESYEIVQRPCYYLPLNNK